MTTAAQGREWVVCSFVGSSEGSAGYRMKSFKSEHVARIFADQLTERMRAGRHPHLQFIAVQELDEDGNLPQGWSGKWEFVATKFDTTCYNKSDSGVVGQKSAHPMEGMLAA